MGRDFHINLAYLPWPVSVLKFNQVIHEMQHGDHMVVKIKDIDIIGNIHQLLASQPDFYFDISQTNTDYRIRVTKRWNGGL